MKTYQPKITVTLIKAVQRKTLAPGLDANTQRYADTGYIDLTPYLSEGASVRVTKSIRQPAGAFSISFADQPDKKLAETVYALVEPMDMVQIRFAHDPSQYRKSDVGYALPIVMRGFVSTVTRTQAMVNGRPSRTVTVAGQDFGKILQIIRIYYLYQYVVGDLFLTTMKFFEKYLRAASAKIMPAGEFVQLLMAQVVNPYMANLPALANGRGLGLPVANRMNLEASIDGVTAPTVVSSFDGGTLYQFITQFCDVGAFNELFVEDREDAVTLVLRPAPLKTVQGAFVQQGASEPAHDTTISDDDIIGINVARSDAQVANYFWVDPQIGALVDMQMYQQAAKPSTLYLQDYQNANPAYYGFRKMQASSALLPDSWAGSDATTVSRQKEVDSNLMQWLAGRRQTLMNTNRDNVIFESGTLQLSGNERIRPGNYLTVNRGTTQSQCYVISVTHDFAPFRSYTTAVQFERGTDFIVRAQAPGSDYRAELFKDAQGVK